MGPAFGTGQHSAGLLPSGDTGPALVRLTRSPLVPRHRPTGISFDLQGFLKSNNLHPVAANFCYVSAGN